MLETVLRSFFIFLFMGVLAILPAELCAQNSRDVKARKVPVQFKDQSPQKNLSKRQAKKQLEKTYAAYFDRLIVEYADRMETNAKNRIKLAKEFRKPQFSDPSYFGHKKPPKKRARGKKRKCKECHMWH